MPKNTSCDVLFSFKFRDEQRLGMYKEQLKAPVQKDCGRLLCNSKKLDISVKVLLAGSVFELCCGVIGV